MSYPSADNIIYNFSLFNDQNDVIAAERYISRDQPFVTKTEDYYTRLIGVSISAISIPLFYYNDDMQVVIDNNGIISVVPVSFEVLFQNEPKAIVFIQQFLNGVNAALQTAHSNTGAPGNAPKFIYNDEFIQLIVDQLYLPQQQIILFNGILVNKFPSLFSKYDTASGYTAIKYGNFGANSYPNYPGGTTYACYVMKCGSKGYQTLQQYYNLLVVSNSMSVNKQLISNSSSNAQSLGIIGVVPIEYDNLINGTPIQHVQEYPTYNDILNQGKLNEIDFKLYLADQNYAITPLFLTPGASITCRIEFINKQLVKNFYPKS